MFDLAVIGAGAAGMMCAAVAGQRGLRVVLIDHADRLAEKIRISGGGRCNFTNREVRPANFLSDNPHFCRSALSAYTPADFIELLGRHRIAWHEKHRGQLFCDESSEQVIDLLVKECAVGKVQWRRPCRVQHVGRDAQTFVLDTDQGPIACAKLVIATGGMAIPQLGATDFGLKIARQFGLKIIEPRPALVPLTFDTEQWTPFAALSGVALQACVRAGQGTRQGEFLEDLLFTHRGLSGPAILQISSYWNPGEAIDIDLAPGRDLAAELITGKSGARQQLGTALAACWPKRLADAWLARSDIPDRPGAPDAAVHGRDGARAGTASVRPMSGASPLAAQRLADMPDRVLRALGDTVHRWRLVPTGTAGYKKAEVMRGGVDTNALDQRSMQARALPGLYFIGEVVDVTGWLGGYNFQWAWASAVACGRAV